MWLSEEAALARMLIKESLAFIGPQMMFATGVGHPKPHPCLAFEQLSDHSPSGKKVVGT